MEIDAIGEILNISLGAASTAISKMLDARVEITTPQVEITSREAFQFDELEPAICVEIGNEVGLSGSNIMLLKKEDVRAIVGMLMGFEIPAEEFKLDEITTSAIGEVMNQMMGSSATALSELLDRVVDISTPIIYPNITLAEFKDKYFVENQQMVKVCFTLTIGDKVESEFMYIIPITLAKEITGGFMMFDDGASEEIEPMLSAAPAPVTPEPTPAPAESSGGENMSPEAIAALFGGGDTTPAPAPTPAPQPVPQPVMQQMAQPMMMAQPAVDVSAQLGQMMELMRQQMEMTQMQMMQSQQAPKTIKVDSPHRPNLTQANIPSGQDTNLGLVMGVPVEVSVEIGRTKKLLKDVLDLNKGSLVVLDKLAGEQVDLYVNGQCIAQGDVVVVEDNFGIRITEILNRDIDLSK